MKLLLFDLDGTLLDTLQDLTDSVNYALESEGLPQLSPGQVRRLLGNGYLYLLTNAAGRSAIDNEALQQRLLKTFRSYYDVHCIDKTAPYPGILQMLRSCKDKGNRIAVISNKGQQAASTLVEKFFGDLVDITVGESEGIRRKPAPDTLLHAMAQLGSTPADTLFIGDSEVDLQAATAAGVTCLSCLWGFRDEDVLLSAGAKHLCADTTELLKTIETIQNTRP